MFGDFLKSLLAPTPSPLTDADARLALAALLVRVARSDDIYARSEIEMINQVLKRRYNLSDDATNSLREQAETLETQAPDTVRFTRAIKDAVAHPDRLAVIEALWSIALADGTRDAEEDALIRLVANLLGITDVESASARQKVAQK